MSDGMKEDSRTSVSRRKVLASLGAAGAALVAGGFVQGGGLGVTRAYADNPHITITIAELRAMTKQPDEWYLVTDPGQSGLFRYDPTDLTTPDNLGTVIVSTGPTPYRFKREVDGYYNVKWWGAKGDGSTVDTTAIRAAIQSLNVLGGGHLFFPRGTYIIDNSLFLFSNITLSGEGDATIIKAKDQSGYYSFLFLGVSSPTGDVQPYSCKNAVVRDMVLDGNVLNRNLSASEGNGCLFMGNAAQYNLIENVTIQHFGNSGGSGNFLTISVNEGAAEDSHSNTVRRCRFYDTYRKSNFAIRFYTDFTDTTRSDEQFTRFVRDNVLEDCVFEGFMWNVVELAGPGTIYNVVRNCTILDTNTLGGFEADKGASFNRFEGNRVLKMSMPVPGSEADTANPSIWAFRSQGTTAGKYQRYPRGNVFSGNYVTNLPVTSAGSCGGLLLDKAIDTVIENNEFRNFMSTSAANRITGIYMINYVERCTIQGGTFTDINEGIFLSGGGKYTDITINGLVSRTLKSFYSSLLGGTKQGISLIGNKAEVLAADRSVVDLSNEDIQIIGNRFWTSVANSKYAIFLRATVRAQIVGNHVDGFLGGVLDPTEAAIITSNRFANTTVGVNASSANARNLILLNLTNGTNGEPIGSIQTSKPAMPTSGAWAKNDTVHNTNPTALTDSGGRNYVVARWLRLTNSSSNVLGTDWAEERVYF